MWPRCFYRYCHKLGGISSPPLTSRQNPAKSHFCDLVNIIGIPCDNISITMLRACCTYFSLHSVYTPYLSSPGFEMRPVLGVLFLYFDVCLKSPKGVKITTGGLFCECYCRLRICHLLCWNTRENHAFVVVSSDALGRICFVIYRGYVYLYYP